jgi:hypothetical protein
MAVFVYIENFFKLFFYYFKIVCPSGEPEAFIYGVIKPSQ